MESWGLLAYQKINGFSSPLLGHHSALTCYFDTVIYAINCNYMGHLYITTETCANDKSLISHRNKAVATS